MDDSALKIVLMTWTSSFLYFLLSNDINDNPGHNWADISCDNDNANRIIKQ